ncbi:MAG: O-antigen ligase family protein [Sphingobacteriales bacterium]|nr:O-antigen ligase family protein [Sphingobacteriales bacterium]OJV97928.1 MAG: hypothetical protein BGO52_10785 [Sphingobacteriales bacterium 44-61]
MSVRDFYISEDKLFPGLIVGALLIESIFPAFAFVKYLIPGIVLFLGLSRARSYPLLVEKKIGQNFFIIVCMILYSFSSLAIRGQNFYSRFFVESFLMLAPLVALSFWNIRNNQERILKTCIYGCIVAYAVQVVYNLQTMGFVSLSEALRDSYMPTETGYIAFVFGLFFVHCFYNDKRKLLLLGVLVFLSFKRINFVAIPAALLMTAFLGRFNFKRIALIAVGINGLLILLLHNFFMGNLDDFIIEKFNMSPNVLSMGRQTILSTVNDYLKDSAGLGIGLGKSVDLLSNSIQIEGINNLHSDLIKIYIEFGILVFCIWIYSLYRINATSKAGLALTIYLNLLFITDNVSVYFFVMIIFYYLSTINSTEKYV